MNRLAKELELIVTSPFQVPLKPLLDALNDTSRTSLLATWVTLKQCHVKSLVYNLVTLYYDDKLMISALRKLCQHRVIAHEVNLVHATYRLSLIQDIIILSSSDDSSDTSSWKSGDATQSLSQTLMPSARFELLTADLAYAQYAPKQLVKLLNDILSNKDDCCASTWNLGVSLVFESQPLLVLSDLDEDALRKAYTNWKIQMQSRDNFEAMVSIHIAASLNRFWNNTSLQSEAPPTSTNDRPIILGKWISQSHEFFTSRRGPATAKATFLRTLKAVIDSSLQPSSDHSEMVAMGRQVMATVDQSSIYEWEKDCESAVIKLSQKIIEVPMPPSLKINAFCVLVSANPSARLVDPWKMFSLVEPLLRMILQQSDNIAPEEVKDPKTFIAQLTYLIPVDQEDGACQARMSSFFDSIIPLMFALGDPSNISIQNSVAMDWALLLMSCLFKRLSEQTSGFLGRLFCSVVRDMGFPEWWTLNKSTPGTPKNCVGLSICPHIAESKRQRLCLRLSRIFSAFTTVGGTTNCQNLEAQRQIDQATPEKSWNICRFGNTPRVAMTSNPEPEDILSKASIPKSLSQELRQACTKIQAAARLHVEERCHILQERCENVEKPLMEERAKVDELEKEVAAIKDDLVELQHTFQRVQSNFSKAREHRAFQTSRANILAEMLSKTKHEQRKLEQQQTLTIKNLKEDKINAVALLQAELEILREENEAEELARKGERLLESDAKEQLTESNANLEAQVAWLKEELLRQEKELVAVHNSDLSNLKTAQKIQYEQQEQQHLAAIAMRDSKIDEQDAEVQTWKGRYLASESCVDDLRKEAEKMCRELAEANEREKRLLDILQPRA